MMNPLAGHPRAATAADAARAERDLRLAQWVAAAAQGNSTAFEAFYGATVGYAHALARRMLHGADTEDLLADAFFEAWRSAAQFDPQRASAVTWLLTIVRSRALDLLRRRAAHPEGAAANESDEACTDAHDDPAEQLWQRQAGTRLDTALRALTATERWLLGLAYYRDCSHSQIATVTGLPLGTVKSTLMRAQVKLRTALAR